MLAQVALAEQLSVPRVHSSSSLQVVPSPVKPLLQSQVKLPTVLVQVASAAQVSVPSVHSLESVQVAPSPE